jgi:Protein of unknown function (DUF4058)
VASGTIDVRIVALARDQFMDSPFPGMDPYLERHWGDVHQSVVTYIRDWLQARLPAELRARMQERVYIEVPDVRRGEYYPDVRVIEHPRRAPTTGAGTAVAEAGTTTTGADEYLPAEPILIHLDIEPITESFVEIVDVKSGHRVVTAIEVLSPTNKRPTEGQRLYLKKRDDLKLAGVNTVEIDLLRGGERVLGVPQTLVPPAHRTAYQVCIWRAAQPGTVAVYPVPLRERLPVISIPLRPGDREVPLALQAILDQCYRNGGYDDIDYRNEPDPPLSADDAMWADILLREQNRR